MITIISLTKPIKAHNAEVTSLEFREPNGDDIMECGMPFSFSQDKRTFVDAKATGELISRLAGIPLSSVKMLCPRDFMAAFAMVSSFFGDSETTQMKSSGATTD